MYEGLTPVSKNAYLGRKLKTSIDNIKKHPSVVLPRISPYKLRTERMFFIRLPWEDRFAWISGHPGAVLACVKFPM